MKIAFLPHWCKWLALMFFFSSQLLVLDKQIDSFNEGRQSARSLYQNKSQDNNTLAKARSTETSTRELVSDLIVWFSLIIYILSKSKRDDDFIQSLRLKSLQFALLLGIILCCLGGTFHFEVSGLNVIELQLVTYLLTFKILKIRSDFQANESEILEMTENK